MVRLDASTDETYTFEVGCRLVSVGAMDEIARLIERMEMDGCEMLSTIPLDDVG